MATIAENLQIIKDSTDAIKQAIIDKGGSVDGDISTWASAIDGIQAGGGAGSVFKITNKLNGQLFGGPNYDPSGEVELLHKYTFEGGIVDKVVIMPDDYEMSLNYYINSYNYGIYAGNVFVTLMNNKVSDDYGNFTLELNIDGYLHLQSDSNSVVSDKPSLFHIIVFDTNGNYDFDTLQIQTTCVCLAKNTQITLSDNTSKLVQDITYNDELLVWNFDEGKYDKAKPLWIKKEQKSNYYYKCTLENGIILNLVGSNGKCHRLFSIENGMFISATDMIGKTTYTESGISKVVSCELIEKEVEFYNIITKYHINCFANGVLTSCRYNNLYPIKDMKFIKDDRLNKQPRWKVYADNFRQYPQLGDYIDGLRLYEQIDIPIEESVKYVSRLEALKKKLTDFEENKTILNDIKETNVGWIDPDGNVYGYKLYMPGQMNHITLADKIGKKLGLQEEKIGGYSRTLEKLGWVKYSNEFLTYSNKKEITDKQERKLFNFINNNEKVKKKGSIKMGSMFGDENKLDYLNMMPRKDFTNKMRGK